MAVSDENFGSNIIEPVRGLALVTKRSAHCPVATGIVLLLFDDALGASRQKTLERLAELCVENCVDDRVYARVDVAEPCGEHEDGDSGLALLAAKLDADRIDDITSEKRNPTEQKHAWKEPESRF